MIKRIRQLDPNGCGIAVVAMAAHVTYWEVRGVLFGLYPGYIAGTSYNDLRRGFDHFKVKYGTRARRFWSWSAIGHTAVVLIKANYSPGLYHWVILVVRKGSERYVIDPYPTIQGKKRVDWHKMKGVSFLEFTFKRKRVS